MNDHFKTDHQGVFRLLIMLFRSGDIQFFKTYTSNFRCHPPTHFDTS